MKYLALAVLILAVCAPAMAHDSLLGNGHRETILGGRQLGGRQQYTGYTFGNGIPETRLGDRYGYGQYPYNGRYNGYDRDSGHSRTSDIITGAAIGAVLGAVIHELRDDDRRPECRPQYRPPYCGQGGPVEYDPTWGQNPIRR